MTSCITLRGFPYLVLPSAMHNSMSDLEAALASLLPLPSLGATSSMDSLGLSSSSEGSRTWPSYSGRVLGSLSPFPMQQQSSEELS